MVCTAHRLQCKTQHFPKHKFPVHSTRSVQTRLKSIVSVKYTVLARTVKQQQQQQQQQQQNTTTTESTVHNHYYMEALNYCELACVASIAQLTLRSFSRQRDKLRPQLCPPPQTPPHGRWGSPRPPPPPSSSWCCFLSSLRRS